MAADYRHDKLAVIPEISACDHRFHLDGLVVQEHDRALLRGGIGMSVTLALWILVAPAANWSWTILDGPFDSAVSCETRRGARLDANNTLCARLPTHHQHDSSPSSGQVQSLESAEEAGTTR